MSTFILSRYVMRTTFWAMAGSVIGLLLLQVIFTALSELDKLSATYTLTDVLWFVLYRSPYFLTQFIPMGVLLGAVVGLGLLAGNSELVVMRAAGVGVKRIIGWVMVPAGVFALLSLSLNQFVIPDSNQRAAMVLGSLNQDRLIAVNGYWAVNRNEQGLEAVYISYADNTGKLGETKHFYLNNQNNLTAMVQASGGLYDDTAGRNYNWRLNQVSELAIGKQGVQRTFNDTKQLTLPIAPTDVHLLTKSAEDLSLTELYAHRQLMRHQDGRSLRHELVFWQRIFSPLSVLSLVLVASSFVFGSLRSQSLGLRIVIALLVGILFSYLTDLTGFIALAIGSSPLLMAVLPIVISTVVGVCLLKQRG